MDDEWGPWTEHDGGECPCVGMWTHAVFDKGYPREISRIASGYPGAWVHDVPAEERLNGRIIRFRVRKPRALLDMIDRAAKLDAPRPAIMAEANHD